MSRQSPPGAPHRPGDLVSPKHDAPWVARVLHVDGTKALVGITDVRVGEHEVRRFIPPLWAWVELDWLEQGAMPGSKAPAQEFGERVAEKWFRDDGTFYGHVLASLIASELRADEWRPGVEGEMNDHAQELAERVAEKYWGMHIAPSDPGYRSLMALIANELQAGGWKPGSVLDPYPTNTMSPHSGYAKQTNEAVTLAKQANPSADIGFISNT